MLELATRMTCAGCGACADACPFDALTMALDREGFAFPRTDASRCVECGLCTQVCPVLQPVEKGTRSGFPVPYAAWSTTPENRRAGSSGGVFGEVAARTIEMGGVVAGARTDGLTVRHDLASIVEETRRFQGSKYLQSETSGIYRRVLDRLKHGQRVVFSGTPCQVAGMVKLASRLGCCDQLITCEVVCLGVPSRRFWQRYVEAAGPDIREVLSFRDKQEGWRNSYAVTLGKGDRACTVRRSFREGDVFLRAFAACTILRNSCYDCPFAALPRVADLTLADFWGLQRFLEEQAMGVSLVVVNSKAGMDLLHTIPSLALNPVEWEEALRANPRVYEGKSYLPWRRFIARRCLGAALDYCSYSMLDRLYTRRLPRWQFWWWPYRAIMYLCGWRVASSHKRNYRSAVEACK